MWQTYEHESDPSGRYPMNNLLIQQLHELLPNPTPSTHLKCEGALRVAAATLCRLEPNELTATTVVCDLSDGDFDELHLLVQEIADEYGVDASIQHQRASSYSVRLTPRPPAIPEAGQPDKSLFARFFRR